MPNIETFTDNIRAPVADQAGSEAREIEGRHLEASYAQAGAAIGGGIRAAGDAVDNHIALTETSDLTNKFASLEMQTAQKLEQSKTSMDPHDTDAASNFIQAQEDSLSQISDNIVSDKGRAMFNKLAADYRVNTFNKVLGYQTTAAANSVISNFKSGFDTRANLAETDPTTVGSSIEALSAAAPGMPAENRDAILREGISQVVSSGAEGVMSKLEQNPNATVADVEKARAFLADPKNQFINNMPPAQWDSVNKRLDRLNNTVGATSAAVATQQLTSGVEQMKSNGGVDNNGQWQTLINGYRGTTPEETKSWKTDAQQKYNDAIIYGRVSSGVNATPDADMDLKISQLRDFAKDAPADQAPTAQAALSAAISARTVRDKAFKENPGEWLNTNSPVVSSRYQAFAQNQTPENFQAYAQASIAEQKRLYPDMTPKILPTEMEGVIGGTIKNALASKEGPTAAAQTLASYAQRSGAYWPQIAIQLRQDKVISGGAGVAAELYGDPKTQALGETVIQATSLPPKELEEKFGITREKAVVAADAQLKPLMKTMGNVPNSDKIVGDYRDALVATMQYTGSVDASSAAALSKNMLLGRYDIQGDTLRIPKYLGLDASRIGDGASEVKADMSNHQLVPPPHFNEMGITPDRYSAQIKATGRWYANETGTGAILYDEDMHTVKEVINGKTRDVELSWDALGKAADKGLMRSAVKKAAEAVP